ncbi:ComEA family DNA-binding protein [Mucilaginibacter sp.]|uniref:ComEA family DNA-binding protein n=1 Tax=Mucilaginibacter sp. TaxID=1882438 RepID=UPI003D0CE798
MKARIKNYLSVTKKEWNGMVILVVLILLVLAAPYVYQLINKDNTINFKDFDKAVALLSKAAHKQAVEISSYGSDQKNANPVMFPFNPNNLSVEQWKQLGLSEHQASVIKHYEAKGGRFYNREDVKKIYAITAADYKRLEPYINIPETEHVERKLKPGVIIELNTADSAKLTRLKGIGPSFAIRIIRYRNRLGGFIYKEQLKEVYGVDSLKYADVQGQVTVNPERIIKIPINTISFDQLRLFPYLSYKQVNAIIQYRAQHGNYTSIADMKNIVLLDEVILRKIGPYLNFK